MNTGNRPNFHIFQVIGVIEIIAGLALFFYIDKTIGIAILVMGGIGFILPMFITKKKEETQTANYGVNTGNMSAAQQQQLAGLKRKNSKIFIFIPILAFGVAAIFIGPRLYDMYTYNQIIENAIPAVGKLVKYEATGTRINREPEYDLTFKLFCFDKNAPDEVIITETVPGSQMLEKGSIFKIILNPEDITQGFIISSDDAQKYENDFMAIYNKYKNELEKKESSVFVN